ncbi:hypothetical protein PGT21_005557 [Puccinia graminis f. sp. tritici]|uniref:DAGKc domain-containing protein n=1 Tax=Puccinia graminis f. sp. tritici TaxID=56615 RepID=A0A5B0QVW1_PUCGR|nr:hypothetical protein PGT21_005557 [Puccinia graminis f. sp. tritici]
MKTERDYLLYVLPPPPSTTTTTTDPVGEEGRPEQKGGLCWLTFPERPQPGRQETRGTTDGEGPATNGAAGDDQDTPKFFSAPPSHQILNIVRENFVPFLQAQGSSRTEQRWMIIWNDRAGERLAKKWLDRIVLPILNLGGIPTSEIQVYQSRQSGWEDELLEKTDGDRSTKVIILGGDGTISDFLNQAYGSLQERKKRDPDDPSSQIHFDLVIVPLGTANAMFFNTHPKVKELHRPKDILVGLLDALLEPTRRADGLPEPPRPRLPLADVQTLDRTKTVTQESVSFVVTSTALHASILETANQLALQPDYESSGIEVFQRAFLSNVSRTWNASVGLLPSTLDGSIQRYDPTTETLLPVRMETGQDGTLEVRLEGPFSYFTACLVDRLESKFIIAPLRNPDRVPLSEDSSRAATIDLVIIRPTRDPSLKSLLEDPHSSSSSSSSDSQPRKEAITKFVSLVLQNAYQDGDHINLLTDDGLPIVEYYRCGGWVWTPTDQDQTHQVCVDGKVIEIPPDGGSVKCTILSLDHIDIRVY